MVIPMPLPQKSEELLETVDTLSQVSAEVAEASLEGIPTSICPIAAVSRNGSITPLVDAMELWENVNKALQDLLTTKASIDACRQRAIWELGMELHQDESLAAESIKEARCLLSGNPRHQDCLLSGNPRCKDCLLSGSQGSQDNPRPYHLRGQSCLLYSHQRC